VFIILNGSIQYHTFSVFGALNASSITIPLQDLHFTAEQIIDNAVTSLILSSRLNIIAPQHPLAPQYRTSTSFPNIITHQGKLAECPTVQKDEERLGA
jgi:hypothetical protein